MSEQSKDTGADQVTPENTTSEAAALEKTSSDNAEPEKGPNERAAKGTELTAAARGATDTTPTPPEASPRAPGANAPSEGAVTGSRFSPLYLALGVFSVVAGIFAYFSGYHRAGGLLALGVFAVIRELYLLNSPGAPAPAEAQGEDSYRANIRTIAGAFLVAIFIRVVVFEAFEIEGPSMEPTFVNGDRVIVAKYPFGLFLPFMNEALTSWGMPTPGDVVIVRSPADNVDIVKRVIGVPGDRIEIRDDVVYRNGEPIRTRELGPCREEESSEDPGICVWYEERIGERVYRTSTSVIEPPDSLSEREVPPGHVFVLGDHRDRSNDSRNPAVGMIPIGRVKGRADAIYWSGDEEIRWDRMFSLVR